MANVIIKRITDTKTRTLVLITVVILIIGIVVAVTQLGGDKSPLKDRPSQTAKIPRGIESTPGGKVTEKYRQLQQEANIRGTKKAEEEGVTFVPTIVGDVSTTTRGTLAERFADIEQPGQAACPPCVCPEVEVHNVDSLLKAHPHLKKLFDEHPELKALVNSSPKLAKLLKDNPHLAKLMAENPHLAKLIAENPHLADMIAKDPSLAQRLADNPELAKLLVENPNMLKMVENDPNMADVLLNNPKVVKILKKNPGLAALIANNPGLGAQLAVNPDIVEAWEKNPDLARRMAAQLQTRDPYVAQIMQDQIQQELETQQYLRQQQEEAQAERAAMLNEARLKTIAAVSNAMTAQASSAMAAWNTVPVQNYVQGAAAPANIDESGSGTGGSKGLLGRGRAGGAQQEGGVPPAIIKSGTIIYATLETAINSDEASPIMAKIVQGKYKGAKLIGTMTPPDSKYSKKVVLAFNVMNVPGIKNSLSVNAVAIDLDTARAAIASRVDNHYLYRYGTLFASSFLEGYSKAVVEKGNTSTTTQAALGTTTTQVQRNELSGKQQLFQGLGKVGETLGTALGDEFNRPPTIFVDAGISFGLLFLGDVSLQDIAVFKHPEDDSKGVAAAKKAFSSVTGTASKKTSAASSAAESVAGANPIQAGLINAISQGVVQQLGEQQKK